MHLGLLDPLFNPLVESFLPWLKGLLHPVSFYASFFSSLETQVDVILASGPDLVMQCLLPLVGSTLVLVIPGKP
jgi:hypothetical protein